MTLEASPPPVQELSEAQQARADQLDDDIEKIRLDIASLTKRNEVLAAALLGSTTVQSQLHKRLQSKADPELSKLLENREQYGSVNAHRLAFGVTSFPFVDPSPEATDDPLLVIRFDINRRGGAIEAPYYILCRRLSHNAGAFVIHKHTLPSFIPLQHYQEQFLGVQDEGYGSEPSTVPDVSGYQQNLEGLVQRVRTDLVGWHLRQDAIQAVQDDLKLYTIDGDSERNVDAPAASRHGVLSFEAVAEDAYYARIVWTNGRVGRLKIGKDLQIERAVVFGNVGGEERRCASYEMVLLDGDSRLNTLARRLETMKLTGLSEELAI